MGDPTVLGWAVTLLYLVAALLTGWASQRRSGNKYDPLAFRLLSAFCWLLGVNKQLDVHHWLIVGVKFGAKGLGLGHYKYAIRWLLLSGAAFVALAATAYLLLLAVRSSRSVRIAVSGLVLVLVYAVLRASIFSRLTTSEFDPNPHLWRHLEGLLELIGTLLMLAGARLQLRSTRRGRPG